MTTPKPRIPRRYLQNALSYVEGLRMELEAGLRPSKGWVAGGYLREKIHWLNHEIDRILDDQTKSNEDPGTECLG